MPMPSTLNASANLFAKALGIWQTFNVDSRSSPRERRGKRLTSACALIMGRSGRRLSSSV